MVSQVFLYSVVSNAGSSGIESLFIVGKEVPVVSSIEDVPDEFEDFVRSHASICGPSSSIMGNCHDGNSIWLSNTTGSTSLAS